MTTTVAADNRGILDEADGTGGWTATDGPTLFTSAPSPVESTGSLGMNVSNTTENAYTSITSDDYSGGGTLAVWMRPFGTMDTTVNGGAMIQVGDGTNRVGYHVGGSDQTGFRHDAGPIEWSCFLLDLANKPATSTDFAGAEGSLDETAITQVGVGFKTIAKSVGGVENCFFDIIRFADNGVGIEFVGGTTSGAAGNMSEAAVLDRGTGHQAAYGIVRELAVGVYGIQGNIVLGDSLSASDQYWTEENVTYSWEDRGLSSNNYYRFAMIGSSTATNCEFDFNSCTFAVPAAASASFDGNGADITVCNITNSVFIGFDQGIETSDDTGDSWINNSYVNCDQVVANGCDLTGSVFTGYVGAANTSALAYNLAVDPDGELDNLTFTMAATATHAIEFGASIPTTITIRGCDFNGYGSSDNANDSVFHFLDTSGTITINLINCTNDGSGFTFRTAGATIDVVEDPVTTKFTVTDNAGTPIENARVLAETADDGGGSGYPFEESVSITQASGTATVTHTAHGLATNDHVAIRGAQPDGYNKAAQITVTGANTYTYTVDSGLSSPATGSPVASYSPIGGQLTNASGVISSSKTWPASQGLMGWARKVNASSPFYKQADITVADASVGTDVTLILQPDE